MPQDVSYPSEFALLYCVQDIHVFCSTSSFVSLSTAADLLHSPPYPNFKQKRDI